MEEDTPGGDGATPRTDAEADGPAAPHVLPAMPEWSFAVPRAVDPQPVTEETDLSDPALYFNRELSWLDFNARVLAQALDERTPMLEQVRFLAITANNLDEFYRKRIGGLKRQEAAGVMSLSPDGRTPGRATRPRAPRDHPDVPDDRADVGGRAPPEAANRPGSSSATTTTSRRKQQAALDAYFHTHIFPILTPLAVDPGHPFPFISNLSLSLAVMLRHPARGTEHFARLKVPISRGRWISIPGEVHHFVARRADHPRKRGRAVPRDGGRRRQRLPHHPQRRRAAQRGRGRRPPRDDLRRGARAAVRRGGPARSGGGHARRACAACSSASWSWRTRTSTSPTASSNSPTSRTSPTSRCRSTSTRAGSPIVPIRLRHEGESEDKADIFAVIRHGDLLVHHPYESFVSVHAPLRGGGRARPAGARHQADAVPHQQGLAHRGGAPPRGRGGQAGRRARSS